MYVQLVFTFFHFFSLVFTFFHFFTLFTNCLLYLLHHPHFYLVQPRSASCSHWWPGTPCEPIRTRWMCWAEMLITNPTGMCWVLRYVWWMAWSFCSPSLRSEQLRDQLAGIAKRTLPRQDCNDCKNEKNGKCWMKNIIKRTKKARETPQWNRTTVYPKTTKRKQRPRIKDVDPLNPNHELHHRPRKEQLPPVGAGVLPSVVGKKIVMLGEEVYL